MHILEVTNLSKKYNDFAAVKHVDFSVEEGEIFGFLGPNGAGKTTTINMITGLARPTSGFITLAGIDCVKNTKLAQRVMGIVPDESNLYDDMNGFENLCFCASLYGMRKMQREEKARELLLEFGLEKAGNRPFKAFSKGMKRKLTIAAGIIHEPKILFMDEPTTGIDVESAKQIRELITGLKRCGTTVFLTTHYIEDAQRLCDRIAFIVEGQIVKIASVNELLESSQAEYIVHFTFDGSAVAVDDELKKCFPDYDFEEQDGICICRAPQPFPILPLVRFFEEKGLSVYEAKSVHPSLEDVFVKITGIEAKKLVKEKEGGRK
ncbi:ABC-2 type transport system ATP-binding protein [Anaerovirgula multivorans]|uniref:ABC-2 type transport system ATP-binding protein n=1 Tax=Anaerovirgula multivorans TaxID=312168 RepID=A0A239CG22_9FIRM|nr:ABC transporter ATP-binding protein [Anaerovirgula multivorans]SNS19176.1 ABC-2 type transport system ATP-binding protein [Anaerovirgula multivorans]